MIGSILRVWPIAMNTLREAIRNKLLYALLFFGVAVIGASVLIASLSYVEGEANHSGYRPGGHAAFQRRDRDLCWYRA